ncbi:MAG: zinc ribbon domain-containing protein [Dehalococcoidia bacterium]
MTLIADLYALQEIDSQIDQRESALESLRDRPEHDEASAEARAELAEHSVGLPELEARQRDLELQVATAREKAAPVEQKLYSGSITNPKELSDLQADLDQLTRQRQGLEEELLTILEQLEAKRAAIAAAREQSERLEADWAAEQQRAQAEEDRLEQELAGLRERRSAAAARIPSTPAVAYDRLRRRRKGLAVVRVERGACLGCRLTVPSVILQRARSGTNPTPVQCPSCERMLYVI